jgi:hypothetical protein
VQTHAQSKSAAIQSLPIKRVVLYSNGVSYIERRGFVNANASIDLSFKQSQVDDVLKSMIVLDLGKGRIGAVSYNSSAPPSARMAEIPFSVTARTNGGASESGISGVLSQLQGARVLVSTKTGPVRGAILTVERQQVKTEKETRIINNLVIASEGGDIMSFDLSDVRGVKLLDSDTKRDVNEFADAAASTRRRDAKTITVTSEGTGRRELMVSYTIAAPIWKTTYRVVLDKEGQPFFQGWAIVDNVSEEDWKGVKLSLVSGSPISFIQELQRPFYRYRPVVPMPSDINISPQVYETDRVGGTPNEALKRESSVSAAKNRKGYVAGSRGVNSEIQLDGASSNTQISAQNSFIRSQVTTVSDALLGDNSGVETAATGAEIGDLFEYSIAQPLTVLRNRSALIPILQTKMEGEKISVYNESVRKDRPLSGMRLVNTSPLTLESGSLTVIDRDAYAGESLMERLKPKEQRLISYALDLGTHVRVRNRLNNEPAKLIKAVNGVFQVHYFRSEEKTYEIANQTDRPKVVYIEYPIRRGWKLNTDVAEPDYTTQKYYRFRVELKPFEEQKFKVAENQPLVTSYQISDLSSKQLDLFVSRRYIDAETRKKLDKLITLRIEASQIENKLEVLEEEEDSIATDQKRLRENITALSKTSEARQLIARYIQKADTQENRIEQIVRERKALESRRQQLRVQLGNEIRAFQFEQRN